MVLGAGYSGMVAAQSAARRTTAQVTLVNARGAFVERVRMHELASGKVLAERPIAELLKGSGVEFVLDRVEHVDAERRVVGLTSGELAYDVLIYALGSRADLDSVPGVREYAYTVADVDSARELSARLQGPGSIAVVGSGLTGLEAVTELAETFPGRPIQLVTAGELGAAVSERGRRHLHKVFDRLGITTVENARVAAVDSTGLQLADGDHVDADVVVWTTGFEVPEIARKAGFAVDERGRIIVDPALRSVSHPDVTAVGDAAVVRPKSTEELRMSCATGIPMAGHAARAVADRLAGREPRALRFRYFNQCISLGRHDALIQFVHPNDSPRTTVLTGHLAAYYKERIVRGALYTMRNPVLARFS
ncbi:FAD-dependent oxidoreductase [Kribbella sandramycini]|uniref:FAD-dependent oxidoreductase n=1 Tax=Kribbella sandramycini TaxID=60450 RepID=A0A7Y4KVD7_9ACTN|nr:FAD-dependent oxidoreductase [Kribbella sandramycini]